MVLNRHGEGLDKSDAMVDAGCEAGREKGKFASPAVIRGVKGCRDPGQDEDLNRYMCFGGTD